jgi:predicted GH43/DUF377 family glycosyl hydrolase
MNQRTSLPVQRLPVRFAGDDRWVITRTFLPGSEDHTGHLFERVSQLSDDQVGKIISEVIDDFRHRHSDIETIFNDNFEAALATLRDAGRENVVDEGRLSNSRRLLIGSYFTMEYSVASAALFNPSIVPHPDQSNVPNGSLRFIMSLRATGEGHLSSIVFRTGQIHSDHAIEINPPGPFTHRAKPSPNRLYVKQLFRRKLHDMAISETAVDLVMNRLPDQFKMAELEHAVSEARREAPTKLQTEETTESMLWLARENYQLRLHQDADISEVVFFPQSENESRGIEDLRLVPFVDDDGSKSLIGTYTAYNGYRVLPQLMQTTDFRVVSIHTLNGDCAQDKGMSLFPRRINGHYCMCSRIDGENMYIMFSDILQFWETAELLQAPKHPWEFIQVGNCGSPLETTEGWLLLTHGVGPMRSYCIGAMLLDLDNPLKVIGHLEKPLLIPAEEEREGYVPIVVYSCGALIHNDYLYLPYAMSDTATGFAMVELEALLGKLTS